MADDFDQELWDYERSRVRVMRVGAAVGLGATLLVFALAAVEGCIAGRVHLLLPILGLVSAGVALGMWSQATARMRRLRAEKAMTLDGRATEEQAPTSS